VVVSGFAVVLGVILIGWTLASPQIMEARSEAQLAGSIMANSRTVKYYVFTDASGSYRFKFGFDYPDVNISRGSTIEFKVYLALVSAAISSPFTRGVALRVDGLSLLVDGVKDSGVRVVSQSQPNLGIYALQSPNTSLTEGAHTLVVMLTVSTLSVNFIGYVAGSMQNVTLEGRLQIGVANPRSQGLHSPLNQP